MGFYFSSNAIEELKSQVNIVDVVSRAVSLKRAGANFKGCCPFHNEKTPSFVVSEQKQIFTCFGCGAKGDLIGFVQKYYNLDFNDAVAKLGEEYGLNLEKIQSGPDKQKYYDINKMAASFWYNSFTKEKNMGYQYMKERGISDAILKTFGIGYADESWDSLYQYLLSKKVDPKDMVELGLVKKKDSRYYDKFRNRVMFPIINPSGKVIGFGGRAIGDDTPKYLNSDESLIFLKKNNLYGLNLSKNQIKDNIILVEGYMDVIGLYQGGIKNVAASLGTALTQNQAKLIKRYTSDVVLSYDADSAGRNAALRGIEVLTAENIKTKVLHVTDGKDPDEFIKKKGKDAFLKLVDNAVPQIEYRLNSVKGNLNLSKDTDKIEYIKRCAKVLNTLSPVEADIYVKKLASVLKVSESAIKMELMGKSIIDTPQVKQQKDENKEEISPIEKNILKILFTNEDFLPKILDNRKMMESRFSNKILDLALENKVSLKNVQDMLDPEESILLNKILDEVKIGGNEEKVFDESVSRWRLKELTKEEKEILTLLSMADEKENQANMKELTLKLEEIQREKNKLSRG
ncbi:MAG: DNA primase [Clostridia bacterium]|nr:DNA primase [Clostridia bacterium]